MSRPEVLFPLFAELETLDGVGPKTARAFEGLGVTRPKDLLYLLPYAGTDRRRRESVQGAAFPTTVTVEVTIGAHLPARRKGGPTRIMVRDALLEWAVVYFHAKGDYLQKLLPTGQRRVLSGKVETFDGVAQMVQSAIQQMSSSWNHGVMRAASHRSQSSSNAYSAIGSSPARVSRRRRARHGNQRGKSGRRRCCRCSRRGFSPLQIPRSTAGSRG